LRLFCGACQFLLQLYQEQRLILLEQLVPTELLELELELQELQEQLLLGSLVLTELRSRRLLQLRVSFS